MINAIKNSAIYLLLYLLPKNFLSLLMGRLVSIHWPNKMTEAINRSFVRIFKIDMNEAEKPLSEYRSLQELFIRKLKPGLRELPLKDCLISPCDGRLSVMGTIASGKLLQAKGRTYSLTNLLQNEGIAQSFLSGSYATIYLSPKDYHRFHMPADGEIIKTIYIPGALWPVNNWAVHNVKELFCQNERVITLIKREEGMIAHIAVGACMVGRIELDYCRIPHYKKSKEIVVIDHLNPISLKKGDDLGRFMFGSTIILLLTPNLIEGFLKLANTSIKVKEELACFRPFPKVLG